MNEDLEAELYNQNGGMEQRVCNLDHKPYGPITFEVPIGTPDHLPCPWHWDADTFDRVAYEETLKTAKPERNDGVMDKTYRELEIDEKYFKE